MLKQYGRWVYCVKFKRVPKQIQSLGILKSSLATLNSYYRFRDCPSTDTAGFILWKGMTHSANSWMWFDSVSLRYSLLLMLLFLSWSLLICIFPKWLCLLVKWESHLTWSSELFDKKKQAGKKSWHATEAHVSNQQLLLSQVHFCSTVPTKGKVV